MDIRRSIVSAAALLCAFGAHAADSPSRYRVARLTPPESAAAGCLSGYAAGASITRINDFGVVNAVFYCHTAVDTTAGVLALKSTTLVMAPYWDGFELPTFNPGFSYSYGVNNRGELFGYESGPPETGGLFAARWTVLGGHERIFYDPACDQIQFQGGVDGNGRYVVGWALRGDPSLPPPLDTLCVQQRWVTRDANGVEGFGPPNGAPSAINAFDMAVGNVDHSAVRYHVPSASLEVLHAADSAHSAEAVEINDLGEAVGRITRNSQPDVFNSCDPSTAVRWDRNGRERVLPNLPGAVSSHAFGVGYGGEAVGDSGAGVYCPYTDNATERAVLWKNGRVHDLNTLIPRGSGITLTYAYSINRLGQITAAGFVNDEPMTLCPSQQFDTNNPQNPPVITVAPCHNVRMFVLTPVGR